MKTLKTVVAFSTPWFDILAKTVDTEDAPYYSLRVPDYAAVLAITEDQRILAVRQYRPAVERYTVELPSGIVDAGETPGRSRRTRTAGRDRLRGGVHRGPGTHVAGHRAPANRIWNCVAKGVRRVERRDPEPGIEVLTYTTADLARAIAEANSTTPFTLRFFCRLCFAGC